MDTVDQKADDSSERKMEELRRLLRRLDRTDSGPAVAIADDVAARMPRYVRFAGQQQPPPLPPLPPLPPRWASEQTTLEPEEPVSHSKRRVIGPRVAAAITLTAIAGVVLILRTDLPRPGAPMPSSAAVADAKGHTDALPSLISAATAVPAPEKPAPDVRAVPSFVPPAADVASVLKQPAPPPPAASEPTPEPVETERRIAVLALATPEKPAASPLASKSGSSASPVLAIPPSFMVEAGVTSPFPLRLARDAGPFDGGYVIISGLLRGSRFSSGTEIVFDTWQIPVSAIGGLQLTIPSDGETEIAIELRSAHGDTVARTTAALQAAIPASAQKRR